MRKSLIALSAVFYLVVGVRGGVSKEMTTISPESTNSLESNSSAKSTKLLQVAEPPLSRQLVPVMLMLPATLKTSEGVVVPMPTLPDLYSEF